MFRQDNRLTKKKDFDRVFAQGRSSFDRFIGLKAVRNDLAVSRFGVIVSTKISKKATERNQIKRRIREAVKERLVSLKPGYDCAIITLPPIMERTRPEIGQALDRLFARLRMYKDNV